MTDQVEKAKLQRSDREKESEANKLYEITKRGLRKQIRRQVAHMIKQSALVEDLSRVWLVFIAEMLVLRAIWSFVQMRKALIVQSREKLNFMFASAELMARNITQSKLT